MSVEPAARFFVNHGIVAGRIDMHHLLRPLLKQTVSYRYTRGSTLVSQGTGWVERVIADRPGVSSYFTPLSICINVDSWEHLEFDTRPDQLLSYVLVQGDERVALEFAPMVHGADPGMGGAAGDGVAPGQRSLRLDPMSQYVQMELAVADPEPQGAATGDEGDGDEGADQPAR
ncbi:MAG: hypothetical protein U0667_11285 [Chloroflexota bacterium]